MIFAYFRLAWARGATGDGPYEERWQTLTYLRDFTEQLTRDIGAGTRDPSSGHIALPDQKLYGEYTKLLARCHVELGKWQTALLDDPFAVSGR